jgi:hypothetical protein
VIALMLKNLPHEVRTRTLDAVRNGTGYLALRTRIESWQTEPVLVPMDGVGAAVDSDDRLMIQTTTPIYLTIPAILLALAWVVGTWRGLKALRIFKHEVCSASQDVVPDTSIDLLAHCGNSSA